MGKRGPSPMPEAWKRHEGTFREDRDADFIRLRPGIPPKPPWLDEVASVFWEEAIAELSVIEGFLSEADGPALAMYCEAMRHYHEYDDKIRRDGLTVVSLTAGPKAHPLLARRDAAMNTAIKIGGKFGLNPSDRGSIKPNTTKNRDDELSELIA